MSRLPITKYVYLDQYPQAEQSINQYPLTILSCTYNWFATHSSKIEYNLRVNSLNQPFRPTNHQKQVFLQQPLQICLSLRHFTLETY